MRRLVTNLLAVFLAVGASCLWISSAAAQDDGARAYLLVPDKTSALSLYGIAADSNQSLDPGSTIPDAKIKVRITLTQLSQTFSIGGNQAAAFVVLPAGKVEGKLELDDETLSGKNSGIGDVILGLAVGLVGSPALAPADYVKHKPGFALGLLGKVYLPTGDYDSSRIINLGASRFAFQLGLPMNYAVGKSLVDPHLMTFELLPSVMFFTDNQGVSQNPLLIVEGHITRNLGRMVWISADARYRHGGETSTDGVSNDNRQSALALGGTIGVSIAPNLLVKATYGGIVSRNQFGPDGHLTRVVLTYVF